ncbi:hypothetical protein [Candidatus Synchoanobacter obligatus]|uniref:Uncharacterized protein n=1 Tax=Candidatus Synchoanobacter obligatus TaxID=2919597 RepID=A0ABT1L5D5_9GAMM|nr:hypothetical protein [Candidatus Synchoanobacter obligatus]MCP8352146.1 hypothetical protein [Candidatus Synchoanobacter obligatus]
MKKASAYFVGENSNSSEKSTTENAVNRVADDTNESDSQLWSLIKSTSCLLNADLPPNRFDGIVERAIMEAIIDEAAEKAERNDMQGMLSRMTEVFDKNAEAAKKKAAAVKVASKKAAADAEKVAADAASNSRVLPILNSILKFLVVALVLAGVSHTMLTAVIVKTVADFIAVGIAGFVPVIGSLYCVKEAASKSVELYRGDTATVDTHNGAGNNAISPAISF